MKTKKSWQKLWSGIALSAVLVSSAPNTFAQTASSFNDVKATNNSQAIQYLKENNVVGGYADGTFKPDSNINRAEFTKILVGSIDASPKGKNCFKDVQEQWFAPYICQAKSQKIIDGYSDGTFKPEQEINFSEAAKIIANAYQLNKGQKDPAIWFREYIEALQNEKAIPVSVEYFDEKITRDEMSEIIYRLKADINNKSSRTYAELNGDGLFKASSCVDLEDRYKLLNQNNYYRDDYYMLKDAVMNEESAPASTGSAPSAPAKAADYAGASSDYSTTNIQVNGVDEADIIKNDGKYIYLIKNNTIRIVQAYPADSLKELISFELGPKEEYFYPTEMYVDNNQMIVIGTASVNYPVPTPYDTFSSKIAAPYYNYSSRTKVYIVDITDRNKPKVSRTVDFDGSSITSRKIDQTLYLVMNNYPRNYYYYSPMPMMEDSMTTSFAPSTGSTTSQPDFNSLLPSMRDSVSGKDELIAPCGDIRIMPMPRTFNFLITAAIPLNDNTKAVSRSVIVGSANNVYASNNNLYVATNDWNGPYYSYDQNFTRIYKFALGQGKVEYQSEGVVAGTVLNQFSMDEKDGNFRIATTENKYVMGDSKTSNNLYILDSTLKPLGKLEDIAKGEKIYSTRFMGDRAYMVTFKSVDPLFVFDLKDPKNPKILGELKIPGYSDYLHPYDENHLIGFGKDVDEAEAAKDQDFVYYTAVKGFKMAMFDVTDPSKPREMFKEIIGDQGTYSELLYNHKALLFDKAKNLIAFPITITEMPKQDTVCSSFQYSTCPNTCTKSCQPTCTEENGVRICKTDCDGPNSCVSSTYVYPKNIFMGAYVYGVDLQNGFKLKAKITHLNSQEITDLLQNGYGNYEKTIQRIIYIGDMLYTVSQGVVKANSLADSLREIKAIELIGSLYNVTYGRTLEIAQ